MLPLEISSSANAATFDRDRFLASLNPALCSSSNGRRLMTRLSPLAFGVIYLGEHLLNSDGCITLADAHLDWARRAHEWICPVAEPKAWRHAFVAPRETGKSTWFHLIIPLWAACHGFARFIAAFSDSGAQAAIHLGTVKHELDTNALLRVDFPGLCTPSKRPTGTSEADRQSLYIARDGFVFAAKGIDAKNLGLKVGHLRPDVIILDDVEPDESSYSSYQRDKRLRTITDAVLPMNERARVMLVGTVTMPDSIIHQTVRSAGGVTTADWIRDEKFVCHHYEPIIIEPDGSERSCWPAKWSLEYLQEIRHTRSFRKNYANDPSGSAGTFWTPEDFAYGDIQGVTRTLLSLDPSTTTGTRSDPAGLAVVGFAPPRRLPAGGVDAALASASTVRERHEIKAAFETGRCVVHKTWAVRLVGEELRQYVLRILTEFPQIRLILVESNQGGDHWRAILHDMPVKVSMVHNTEPKEVRAAALLHHYQMGRVVHAERLVEAEGEMGAFPHGAHDDLVDAVGTGVFRFIPPTSRKPQVRVSSDTRSYA